MLFWTGTSTTGKVFFLSPFVRNSWQSFRSLKILIPLNLKGLKGLKLKGAVHSLRQDTRIILLVCSAYQQNYYRYNLFYINI
jgi:hypothetical protein